MLVILVPAEGEFIAVFNSEHNKVKTSRRGVSCTRCKVYNDGLENRDEGDTYICLERRTSKSRRTSVLLLSYGWLGPGSEVDPIPFSLGKS
jgi:hypothetical protein